MNTEFLTRLAEKLAGVNFISETDAPFEVLPEVREKTFNDFFASLVKEHPNMDVEERTQARKWREIKNFIDANMKRKRVYLIGKINVDILIVGRDLSGAAMIIKTFTIQT